MVWDPARIAPATWPSALAHYRHIEDRNHDFAALRQLVEHVGIQSYASALACATSGTSLLVALVVARPRGGDEAREWAKNSLRIDLDLSGAIRFVHNHPALPKPNVFVCDGSSIVATFERFLVKARWSSGGASGRPGTPAPSR